MPTALPNLNAFALDANARHKAMDRLASAIASMEAAPCLDAEGITKLAGLRTKLDILKSYK